MLRFLDLLILLFTLITLSPVSSAQSISNSTDFSTKMRGLFGFLALAQLPFSGGIFGATTLNDSILNTESFSSPKFSRSAGGKAVCVEGYLQIPVVNATNIEILYDGPADNFQLTALLLDLFALDSTATSLVGGTTEISATYTILSKICVPKNATAGSVNTIHFLTHGGSTDITYWDFDWILRQTTVILMPQPKEAMQLSHTTDLAQENHSIQTLFKLSS